ncbi:MULTISPECIES: hypothetical protein [unclassified Bradyrhizobium]|nr:MULTISPECIES: hypothetical protein [unclassified Bradyrhizobium]MDI4233927.1 hypothetical protein [Bradyrhizobium sp. Arg237L]
MMLADLCAVEASEKIAMRVLPFCPGAAVIFHPAPQIENNVVRLA